MKSFSRLVGTIRSRIPAATAFFEAKISQMSIVETARFKWGSLQIRRKFSDGRFEYTVHALSDTGRSVKTFNLSRKTVADAIANNKSVLYVAVQKDPDLLDWIASRDPNVMAALLTAAANSAKKSSGPKRM